jgi:hypothetical protein
MITEPIFNKYMDQFYDYHGKWDCPSRCGIKVHLLKDGHMLVIATELYRYNPGTPVTEWCAQLASRLIEDLHCDSERLIFIEHTPDMESKLNFYSETFYRVFFEWDGGKFVNPAWQRTDVTDIDRLLES